MLVNVVYECPPGRYVQWREVLPLFDPNDEDWVPSCYEICNERCGPSHKGVSVCGSMFEYADNPDKDPVCTVSEI